MSFSFAKLNMVTAAATGTFPMGLREALAIEVQKLRC